MCGVVVVVVVVVVVDVQVLVEVVTSSPGFARGLRARIVSEEGSHVLVVVAVAVCVLVVVAVAVCVLVVSTLGLLGLPALPLGLLDLPALPRGLLRNASPVGGEAHEAILDAPGHAVLVEVANPNPHSLYLLSSVSNTRRH